jgi:phosphatidylinositol phospholipase C beta
MKNIFSPRDSDNDVVNDPAVKSLVSEQTNQWSEMVERHRREEWQLLRTHLQAQEDVLKKLMEQQQLQQMKDMEILFEK